MTSERIKDIKESRIGVESTGVITLGTGEKTQHFLIDADHVDTLASTTISLDNINVVLKITGEQSHLRFPDLDPEKVTFVQIEGNAVTAREHLGGMGKNSRVIFTLHGHDMVTTKAHKSDLEEQDFSHLFLEPQANDTMDFHELPRNNGDTDFLIIHHNLTDPSRATIYFLANRAEAVQNGISKSEPKVDLLQFVEKVHMILVDTAAPDFKHLPEQDEIEAAIISALAKGNLTVDGHTKTTFDMLPRESKILGYLYRIQAQFALRGRERFTGGTDYYSEKLQQLVPFWNKDSWLNTLFARLKTKKQAFGMTKWEELTYDTSKNNIRLSIARPPESNHEITASWEKRWERDIPLDEVGRLTATEQNDYLANRLVAVLACFEQITFDFIDGNDVSDLWKQIEKYASLVTTVNRQRLKQNSTLPWPLDYSNFYDRLKLGIFNAHTLVPFFNGDDFNLALSRKSRHKIVEHTLERWESMLSSIKKNTDALNAATSLRGLKELANGDYGYQFMTQALTIHEEIQDLYNCNGDSLPSALNPYYVSEFVLLAKTLFVFAAEYHQLKEENRAPYNLNVWSNQLNETLKKLQRIRLGM